MAVAGVLFVASGAIHFSTYLGMVAPDSLVILPLLAGIVVVFGPVVWAVNRLDRRRVASWDVVGALPLPYVLVGLVLMAYVVVNFFANVHERVPERRGDAYVLVEQHYPHRWAPITAEQYQQYHAQFQESGIRILSGLAMFAQYGAFGMLLAYSRLAGRRESAAADPDRWSGAPVTFKFSRAARWMTWVTAATPLTGALVVALLLCPFPASAVLPPALAVVLVGGELWWLVHQSGGALRTVALVDLAEDGLRARDLLGRERRLAWGDIAGMRDVQGSRGWREDYVVDLVGRDGKRLLRLTPRLERFDQLLGQVRARVPDAREVPAS